METPEITIDIEAMEPMELLRHRTPDNVWMRLNGRAGHGDFVQLRGEREAVLAFVAEHWGDDEADSWAETV